MKFTAATILAASCLFPTVLSAPIEHRDVKGDAVSHTIVEYRDVKGDAVSHTITEYKVCCSLERCVH